MKDKEKLKKLIEIVQELMKIEGNEWMIEEILENPGQRYSIDRLSAHPIMNEIYEHCIRRVVEKQASEFYSKFPINEKVLKKNLIYDFSEMEYNHRRDRFYEFSLCLYQQIEGVVNFLFENGYEERWSNLSVGVKNRVFEDYQTKKGTQVTNTLQEIIIPDGNKNGWSFMNKFRLIWYFINKKNDTKLPHTFRRDVKILQEIKEARNEAHRGGKKYPNQKKILEKIEGNKSRYYLKFKGFLFDFITRLEESYKKMSNKGSNTIGSANPGLLELKQQMIKDESEKTQ